MKLHHKLGSYFLLWGYRISTVCNQPQASTSLWWGRHISQFAWEQDKILPGNELKALHMLGKSFTTVLYHWSLFSFWQFLMITQLSESSWGIVKKKINWKAIGTIETLMRSSGSSELQYMIHIRWDPGVKRDLSLYSEQQCTAPRELIASFAWRENLNNCSNSVP